MAVAKASPLIAVLLVWQLAALRGLPEYVLLAAQIAAFFAQALATRSSTRTSARASGARCPAS
jgi:hypothetical protein